MMRNTREQRLDYEQARPDRRWTVGEVILLAVFLLFALIFVLVLIALHVSV
jgi:hypothetical protein